MSIKLRLFLILILATGAIWLSALFWIDRSTRTEVERVLDARLAEAANMVSSLISDRRIAVGAVEELRPWSPDAPDYSRQLFCQIWSLHGDLVSASSGAPDEQMTHEEGFSTNLIEGEEWRVYSVHNQELGVWVMVGDRMLVRDRLVFDVVKGLLKPALMIVPLLALMIWISVSRGLAPLARLETALSGRSSHDLGPLPEGPAPREIRPVRHALNQLFAAVERARHAERDFTAFAAHELKTPLAGLRTQAQIARMAPDAATRDRALQSMIASVDRTDRMARQLLELATVEGDQAEIAPLSPQDLAEEVCEELAALAAARKVTLDLRIPADLRVRANRLLLYAALRNVVENAVLASPAGGVVTVDSAQSGGMLRLSVRDQGPGIAPEERDRITERFYRGPQAVAGGSGLGLAIASAAMERMAGRVEFSHLTPGLEVGLVLPLA
ncbi:ATP-binding protein [Paracoccus sulfuroxidans]|uniref:histidine kinase n=1 Tax=Paracoccus sulfuroxidans TaxID=384678 RepID=A0A562NNQ8_9RHOB|nr:ATP-binding protein [Paracoccus sulfuroxidans]TWI33720.1 two-component system sensor histidine kinase QseC [Paracoccus sulfuroxidans]